MENNLSNSDYAPEVDGIKAIAVLAVIVYHAKIFSFSPGGFTGVDVFFVTSGYLISRSLFRKPLSGLSDYLLAFYKGRIVRIFPALIVCLVMTMLAATLFIPSSWLSSTNSETGLMAFWGGSNFSLVQHANGYFSPRVEFNPFLHTWSLTVGEQFYLFFPLLFHAGLKPDKRCPVYKYLSWGALSGLTILSLAYAYFATGTDHDQAFYLLPGRFWELGAGVLLFKLHSNNLCRSNSKNTSDIALGSGIALLGIGFLYSDQSSFPFPWTLIPVAGTMFLLSGVTNSSSQLSVIHKILQLKFITYVGRISFPLYLWHWPIFVLFRWTVGFDRLECKIACLMLAFLLAGASYRFVELPVCTNNYLQKQENWKLIVCGITLACVSFFIASYVDRSQPILSLSVTRDRYTWYSGYGSDGPKHTSTDLDIAGRQLFVIGDSHAAAYRTMLKEASTQLGIDVHLYEHGGCPVASLLMPMSQTMLCKEYYDNTLAEVGDLAKPGDIVFLPSLRMPELSDQFEVTDEATVIARFNSQNAVEYRRKALEDASRLIETFTAKRIHVLFEAPLPVFRAPPYRCSDWFNRMNPICTPGFLMDRGLLLELRQPVMDSLEILEHKHRDLFVWDPFFVLCKNEACSAYDDGKPLFFDGDHLSAHGNRVLAPSFINKISDIWQR
ncbi:MAG TPA: acyltransferase family protein [Anaerolineales bacterium]|nr:acyltransferase family protein [Anaerolineales bacterium]